MPSCNTSPGITSNPSGTSGGLKERRSWLRSNEPGRQPLAKIKLSLLFKRRVTSNESYGCADFGVGRISYASCDFTGKHYGYHGRDHYDHDHYYHEGRSDGNNYRSDRPSIDLHF